MRGEGSPANPPLEFCEAAREAGWKAAPTGWVFTPTSQRVSFDFDPSVEEGLGRLFTALAARDVDPIVVLVPTQPMVLGHLLDGATDSYDQALGVAAYHRVRARLEDLGAETVDLLAVASQDPESFFLMGDSHWSPVGSHATAVAVGEHIRARVPPPTLPLQSYRTETREVLTIEEGSWLGKKLARARESTAPPFSILRYVTRMQGGSVGLFDELPAAEVVLLGTSYSGAQFNFGGFLQEELSTAVIPAMVSGGGPTASIRNYVVSDSLRATPPTFMIWEFPIAHIARKVSPGGLQDPALFRELVPAVYGTCSDSDAVATTSGVLRAGETVLFSGLEGVSGPRDYLALQVEDLGLVRFSVVTHRAEGDDEVFELAVPDRVESVGRFFLALEGDAVGAVSLRVEETTGAGFTARLCRTP